MSDRRPLALLASVLSLALSGCADEGFGRAPGVAATLPPPPPPPRPTSGSLYDPASFTSLVGDRRARRVGDLVTILLTERTQARKSATSDASRDSQTALALPDASPFNLVPKSLTSGGTKQNFKGAGSAAQDNQLSGAITVTVARVLPGGVLMVAGEKRLTLNRGEEQVQLTGLVRVDDLGPDNSIVSSRVADARIRYSGTGQIADQSRQGWLARFFTKVAPL
ncbi:flagellar basal body L-ring protein FlgH [Polymorphobacter fuscus]|uniref:Flagellar L-ring protein n=1 Tax=Sandarakinorhabdus fusca TaxID=1439888 RepID=A0A7C9GMQ3_9SPHN|nr:flagellar basal body L-ring protein FlgH [Polymorphobacter fuscus]KAB7648227.1 flagellar basal body L-ring protein FlgH [Polymorphobacter fuscus]MQT15733.1 flagellar biosynthesis protein FlgH [Polymorphobacter fuscus]NJC07996.1 flagellar L-ring protein precursor FlgH [Polymorphobacter fuscus]